MHILTEQGRSVMCGMAVTNNNQPSPCRRKPLPICSRRDWCGMRRGVGGMFKLGGESIEVSVIVATSRDKMKCHASRVPKILRQITHEFVWYGTHCRGRVVGIEFGMLANPIGLCLPARFAPSLAVHG